MTTFTPKHLHFGPRKPKPDDPKDDDGRGLPRPTLVQIADRRGAGIREAKEILEQLPGPNESLHAVATHRMDMSDLVNVLLLECGPCRSLWFATLGYNERNLAAMLGWLTCGAVAELGLLTSDYFAHHKEPLWRETIKQFRLHTEEIDVSAHCAAARSHAKVITLDFKDGRKFSIEGSANLCGNGSGREQFSLACHADLHDWHQAWVREMVSLHELDNGPRSEPQTLWDGQG